MDHCEETPESADDQQSASASAVLLLDVELVGATEVTSIAHIESEHRDRQELSSVNKQSNPFSDRQELRRSSKAKKQSNHRKQYLKSGEDNPAAFYVSFEYDTYGVKHSQSIWWLYKKTDVDAGTVMLACSFCEKYCMTKNTNGKENTWATKGFNVLALDKIKEHRSNEKHREAEQLEVQRTSMEQPGWLSTRAVIHSRQQESIMNLMLASVFLCQTDHSLNSFSHLCDLLEKTGTKLLPAEVSGVSYRNNTAALTFLQHVASVLHIDLVNKLKESPVLGKCS